MSSLKLNSSGGGSVTLTPASTASNLTATVPAVADTLAVQGQLGLRNKIINGAMMIDQRNAGASVSVTGNVYTIDRWNGGGVNDGVLAIQQVSDGPTGFKNSLKVTVSTADTSLGATQYARIGQLIEGYNVSDLAGGTASPATITFSFWVKSSLTGTFGGYLSSGDESRIYIYQYTINSANTWEYKTVTVTLPTSGTWATNNDAGMRAFFSLGAGSTYTNTANTWITSYAQQASGNINVINTLSATWQITGVQLEKGSTATPFENRLYGTELALCQRYYQKSYDTNSSVPTVNTVSGAIGGYKDRTSDTSFLSVRFKTEMRATPTVTTYDYQGNAGKMAGGSNASLSATVYQQGTSGFNVVSGTGNPGVDSYVNYAASIEL